MISQSIHLVGRVVRAPAVHATAAMASLPIASAALRAFSVSGDVDPALLAAGISDANLWITLGVVALFGALGGLVAELLSLHGNIELPHRIKITSTAKRSRLADPRYEIDLGVVARLFLGALAGIALLAVYVPPNAIGLAVNGLIGGSAATGVFRLAQARLLGGAATPRAPHRASTEAPKLTALPTNANLRRG